MREYPLGHFPCVEFPYSFLHSALQTGFFLVIVPAFALGALGLAQKKPKTLLLAFLVTVLLIQPVWEYTTMLTRWSALASGPTPDPFSYLVLGWGWQALFNIAAFVAIPTVFGSMIYRAIGAQSWAKLVKGLRYILDGPGSLT